MKILDTASISRFLAFTVWPKADFINIDDLNSIELQNNDWKDLNFFKTQVLDIFKEEIASYKLKDWENIWVLLSWWLDSTLLLALLKEQFPNSTIYTYTLAYNSSDAHLPIAREIATKYSTIHREVIYSLASNLEETFNDIYSSSYDLEWEDSLIMNHVLAKEVKKDCKFVFSGFGLDYMFAWMDLFRNSFMEKLYNMWKIDKKYILEVLWWNKYYLKYVLDKIGSDLWEEFFIKYWEYYGNSLKGTVKSDIDNYFLESFSSIRSDVSLLKKQIYFIISTSLSNRYNPYNKPYELEWVRHYNPFWSRSTIEKVISLNIPDNYLYNVSSNEKKFIIRDIFRDIAWSVSLEWLHSWTVLKYDSVIKNNKDLILSLVKENKEFLLNYFSEDYLYSLESEIENSVWYEKSKQIVILLQFLFYCKHNDMELVGWFDFKESNFSLSSLKLA